MFDQPDEVDVKFPLKDGIKGSRGSLSSQQVENSLQSAQAFRTDDAVYNSSNPQKFDQSI